MSGALGEAWRKGYDAGRSDERNGTARFGYPGDDETGPVDWWDTGDREAELALAQYLSTLRPRMRAYDGEDAQEAVTPPDPPPSDALYRPQDARDAWRHMALTLWREKQAREAACPDGVCPTCGQCVQDAGVVAGDDAGDTGEQGGQALWGLADETGLRGQAVARAGRVRWQEAGEAEAER